MIHLALKISSHSKGTPLVFRPRWVSGEMLALETMSMIMPGKSIRPISRSQGSHAIRSTRCCAVTRPSLATSAATGLTLSERIEGFLEEG